MEISNDSVIPLPADLERAILLAKNSLTLTEQEAFRLRNLAKDQELLVKQYLEQQAALQEDLTKKKEELGVLEIRVRDLNDQLDRGNEGYKLLMENIEACQTYITGVADLKNKIANLLKDL